MDTKDLHSLFRTIREKYIDTAQSLTQISVELKQFFRTDVMLEIELTAVIKYCNYENAK